jgi:large subunit ribosomal protein L29
MTMKAEDLRKLSLEKIEEELGNAKEEYFKLRFQVASGQQTDHTRLRIVRRDIARIKTVLREKTLEQANEVGEG